MSEHGEHLARLLQAAVDATRDLAQAGRKGSSSYDLDQLAGQVIQHTGAFRAALRSSVIHWRSSCEVMGYDGAACLAEGGECTTDPARVTCSRCRDVSRPPVETDG